MIVRLVCEAEEFDFEVNSDWNILFLKQRACQLFSVDFDAYSVYLNQERLNEDRKISTCSFAEGCRIELIKRQLRNKYFVYCYVCEVVSPSLVSFICDVCGFSEFMPSVVSDITRTACGKCCHNDCQSHSATVKFICMKSADHQPTVMLRHIRRNLELIPCVACCNQHFEVLVSFCQKKSHALCLECFKSYSKEYLESGQFQLVDDLGFTLGCPAGCLDSFISDPHHFRILGKEFYSRYKDFSASRYIQMQDCVVCPVCGQIWNTFDESHSPTVNTRIPSRSQWYTCKPPMGCGSLFCAACLWHFTGIESDSTICRCDSTSAERFTHPSVLSRFWNVWRMVSVTSEERDNQDIIAKVSRPCPRCRSATEKAGGCNHIHCSVCGIDWCWVCCEPWTGDCQALHWL
ncbi:parkin [Paragonimus westermani]|uniref:RBR-type E3 ubiquitin transferase n=1 Tax=Paragonimus westermani TaxID=34504 RepID=A0A5J4NKE8_9TREM|nr:parkin [Paragonimus westermani]